MKHGYIKSSPRFFRMIGAALALFTCVLLCLTLIIPAPLQEKADISRVPNPVKSAWFLLWIQELVSYSKYLIDLVLLLALLFLLLPWLPRLGPAERAKWLSGDQVAVNILAIVTYLAILALTAVAMFFRGGNWAFVSPF
ncbi:MAG TPA: selenite/tellurite reduction operon b-type cytochrome membrane protein ExtQ [Desulfuromonadaceae bacterium]